MCWAFAYGRVPPFCIVLVNILFFNCRINLRLLERSISLNAKGAFPIQQ